MENRVVAEGRSIALVGMMGAGKSTIGRRLARRLGLPFVDSDTEVETAAGQSVADLFEAYGEPAFRDGEQRVIARLVEGPQKVIATGGGAFVHPDTRALLKAHAVTIWLDADLDLLVTRVARRDTRPLVRGRDAKGVLEHLSAIRSPLYAEADLTIRSENVSPDAVVDRAVAALLAWSPL